MVTECDGCRRLPGGPRTLFRMRTQRQVVDYSLQTRALLREVHSGRVGTYEVCDASPYLKSAARFHGEPTESGARSAAGRTSPTCTTSTVMS